MERPALTHKVGNREIRWTYGLQNDLQRLVPDASQIVTVVLTDPFARDYLIRRALTDKPGTIEKEEELLDIGDVDLDPDAVNDLLDWITGHLLYFFAITAANMSRRGLELKQALPQLPPSTDGSES